MPERLHVFVSGRVQGVGFRQSTQDEAERLGLTGWVRNCDDGRVEAVFCGARELLEMMLRWCHQGNAFARVDHVDAEYQLDDKVYPTFAIRY